MIFTFFILPFILFKNLLWLLFTVFLESTVYSTHLHWHSQARYRHPHSMLAVNGVAIETLSISWQTSDNIWSHRSTFIHTKSIKCVHHGIGSFACWNESFGHNVLISWSRRPRLVIAWIHWFRMAAFPLSLKAYSNITKSSFRIRLGDASRISWHESRRFPWSLHAIQTSVSNIHKNIRQDCLKYHTASSLSELKYALYHVYKHPMW
jgi:hypothetical protein